MKNAPGFALASCIALLGAACFEGDPSTPSRESLGGFDGGVLFPDADPPSNMCGNGPPTIGSGCPRENAIATCTYVVGQCVLGQNAYDMTQDYCCFLGVWQQCGGNTTPCDRLEPDAAAVDAPARADAGVDAGRDGGMDAGMDAGGDSASDGTSPDAAGPG